MFKFLEKHSLGFVAFLQATLVFTYILGAGSFIWQAQELFGNMAHVFGPILFLSLFSASALICGLAVFAFPVYLFLSRKKTIQALKVLLYTATWMFTFTMGILIFLISQQG